MPQDNNTASTAAHPSLYQSHLKKAQKLLASWQAGDPNAAAQFYDNHPQGKEQGFVPNLLDARLIVSARSVKLQDLKLDPLKKQAKNLLKRIQRSDPAALDRLKAQLHENQILSAETIKLADCQFIIARELGLSSWAKLKQHITALDTLSHTISNKSSSPALKALDRNTLDPNTLDPNTLHIRCGSDIEDTLPKAGFSGTFFEILEVFVVGSLEGGAAADLASFFKARAQFLSATFAGMPPPPGKPNHDMRYENVLKGLIEDREKLEALINQHDTLCLWFEHDSHDQLILAMLLHLLKKMKVTKKIEIVSPHKFPGLKHFVGLGQLSQNPEMIRLLWQQRQPVTTQYINEGAQIWQALCASDPTALKQLAGQQLCLPHMAKALLWHLNNLPSVSNGLSIVEENTLKVLQRDGEMFMGKLFHFYNFETDPIPTLGDQVYFAIVNSMINAQNPAIRYTDYDPKAPNHKRGTLTLTPTGEALLKEDVNWLEINQVSRWVGGVKVNSNQPNWRRTKNGDLIYG